MSNFQLRSRGDPLNIAAPTKPKIKRAGSK
jgi:hypothetical protein